MIHDELRLALLGKVEIYCQGTPLKPFASLKGQALLIYLAVTRETHSRDVLANLLWSEMPDQAARTNLRVTLSKLRSWVGDYLTIERRSVSFDLAAPHWLDVVAFEQAVQQGIENGGDRARLRTAVDHYRGDFLDDFYVPDAPVFAEWVLVARERMRHLVFQAYHHLVEQALAQPELVAEGIEDARSILQLDEWREEAHQQLMRLLALNGQRSEALAQFEQCRQVLAEALGVEPAAATITLYEEIKAGLLDDTSLGGPVTLTPLTAHNLPAQTTPFWGREEELGQIAALLADEACRLVTLVGPGGMGKTRLGMQVAHQQVESGRFSDGVFFISLTAVQTRAFLVTTIADGLGLRFSGSEAMLTQLLNYVRQKNVLLVLDNFEQIVAQAGFLVEMLQASPGLKILVTSREPLQLYEEWLFEVGGLSVPDQDTAEWQQSSSIQLFAQQARRVDLGFSVAAEKTAVITICRLLQGMPLGIELAAAWVRLLPCAEIGREIERNLDFLHTQTQNVPERHRSLRATFAYSWQLLPPAEQTILKHLTIFQGGFTRAAAEAVTGATLRSLLLLVDKSFLRRSTAGRYTLHDMIRQFAREKLSAAEQTAVQQKHGRYYADLSHVADDDYQLDLETGTLADMNANIENVRQAWQWAIEQQAPSLLGHMLEGLYRFYMMRGWHQEGDAALHQAAVMLARLPGSEEEHLLARVWARQGQCCQLISHDLDKPQTLFEQSLAVFRRLQDEPGIALAVFGLGFVAHMRSHYETAEAHLQESITLCRRIGALQILGNALNVLSRLASRQGDFERARALCQESLQVRRSLNDINGLAASLNTMGAILCNLGEYEAAQAAFEESGRYCRQLGHKMGMAGALTGLFQTAYFQGDREAAAAYSQESLASYRDAGDRWGTAIALHNCGYLAIETAQYEVAHAYFQEAIEVYRQIGVKSGLANSLKYLALAARPLGQMAAARSYLFEALQIAYEVGSVNLMMEILVAYTDVLVEWGAVERSLAILTFISHSEQVKHVMRQQAQELAASLRAEHPTAVVETPIPSNEALKEMVAIILQRPPVPAND